MAKKAKLTAESATRNSDVEEMSELIGEQLKRLFAEYQWSTINPKDDFISVWDQPFLQPDSLVASQDIPLDFCICALANNLQSSAFIDQLHEELSREIEQSFSGRFTLGKLQVGTHTNGYTYKHFSISMAENISFDQVKLLVGNIIQHRARETDYPQMDMRRIVEASKIDGNRFYNPVSYKLEELQRTSNELFQLPVLAAIDGGASEEMGQMRVAMQQSIELYRDALDHINSAVMQYSNVVVKKQGRKEMESTFESEFYDTLKANREKLGFSSMQEMVSHRRGQSQLDKNKN